MRLAVAPRSFGWLRDMAQAWLLAQEGRFASWLPVCAIAGDALYFACRREPPLWLGGAVLGVGAGLVAWRRHVLLHGLGLALALAGFGFAAAQFACWQAPAFAALPSHSVQVLGRVRAVEVLAEGQRLVLDRVMLDGAAMGQRRLAVHAGMVAVSPGQEVSLRVIAAPPAPPAYPGARDLQRDAWFDGIGGYGYALGTVTVRGDGGAGWLARLRQDLAARVRNVLPGSAGAIAVVLLTGDGSQIDAADRAAFRDAGLAHLLAIAGLHIGIVMGLALWASRLLLGLSVRLALFWPLRELSGAISLAAGLGYLVLTGAHVPTLRSFAMASLVVLALVTGRRALSLRSWGLACLVVIALQPEQVTGPSFQLSFAAVLALIAGYEVAREPLQRLRGDGRWWRLGAHHGVTLVLTSLLAGIASMPFVAFHFGAVQVYFVAANLVAVPLMAAWVMPAGLAALALMPLRLERLALVPMGWGLEAILAVARRVAAWPAASLAVPGMTLWALLPIASGLAWLCLWRGRLRLAGLALMLVGVAAAAVHRPPDILVSPDSRLVGVRGADRLALWAARGGDAYVAAAWTRHLGIAAEPAGDARACPDTGCPLGAGAVLGDMRSACTCASLMIAQQGTPPYCPGAQRLGREESWNDGAWAVWLGPSIVTLSDRQWRGARPWVFLPPEQQRAAILLPMARVDKEGAGN